jgi:hypothetical protein
MRGGLHNHHKNINLHTPTEYKWKRKHIQILASKRTKRMDEFQSDSRKQIYKFTVVLVPPVLKKKWLRNARTSIQRTPFLVSNSELRYGIYTALFHLPLRSAAGEQIKMKEAVFLEFGSKKLTYRRNELSFLPHLFSPNSSVVIATQLLCCTETQHELVSFDFNRNKSKGFPSCLSHFWNAKTVVKRKMVIVFNIYDYEKLRHFYRKVKRTVYS